MHQTISPETAILLSFCGLVFLFCFFALPAIILWVSGWQTLAKHFRAVDIVTGTQFDFCSGRIGRSQIRGVNYNRCLFVTICQDGFRLSIIPPFSLFAPPLFLPFSKIIGVNEEKFLFFKYQVISLADVLVTVSLYGKAGQALLDAYNLRSS